MDMTEQIREPYINSLQNGWGTYVERVKRLSPQGQADYLHKQGYASLASLLGHVIAWWEQGMPAVENSLVDPDSPSQDYDVDAFNARAVERFNQVDEATIIQTFEARRKDWIKLVENLPEVAFSNEKLLARLYIELIGHLEEHEISET